MYTLAIIAMFKNESLIIEEWIKYYLAEGVEHFYFIDNGSTDNYKEKISKYMDKITLIVDPFRVGPKSESDLKIFDDKTNSYVFKNCRIFTQPLLANNHFLEKIRKETKWIIFIDPDEYIYIPNRESIHDWLITIDENKKLNNITDVFIPWKIFGSNDLDKQPKSIINGFNKRMSSHKFIKRVLNHGHIRFHGKSITRTNYLNFLGIHQCKFNVQQNTMLSNKSIVQNNNVEHLKKFIQELDYSQQFIYCNHYMVMSKEYFNEYKGKRTGGCTELVRSKKYWEANNSNDEVDNVLINSNKIKIL